MKVVIIGLGTAGFAAALAIKKQDRKAEITFIDKKDFDLLHVCGLPYVLERRLHSFSKLKHDINAKAINVIQAEDEVFIQKKLKKIGTVDKGIIPIIGANRNLYFSFFPLQIYSQIPQPDKNKIP